ncbi:MAG: ring canal kelch-like protein, partial [Microscillaceae bacterium]|nr:ring canal kelch-like protein [Microscillaceae bacterium]
MNVVFHQKRLSFLIQRIGIALLGFLLIASCPQVSFAQSFDFGTLSYNGFPGVSSGTSLHFGPDGRLYVLQLNGHIKIYTITRTGQALYQVTAYQEILTVKNIPNHDDFGGAITRSIREATGIIVGGTAASPVIYVSSSDGEWGGPNGDTNLDTNSGIITQISWTGSVWQTIDLVRGLPRSEENHATNNMELVNITGTKYLIVCSGGFTNAGAPSNNLAYITEYALSAAILAVNVDMLNSMPTLTDPVSGRMYKYDLPTLDDPTRANVNGIYNPNQPGYSGVDVNDPWGGNDGLNQPILQVSGPVQMFSPGYRNTYDLVVTEAGKVYVTDNGANGGWGGLPEGEGNNAALVSNAYNPAEPGSSSNVNGEKVDNVDHLDYITSDI